MVDLSTLEIGDIVELNDGFKAEINEIHISKRPSGLAYVLFAKCYQDGITTGIRLGVFDKEGKQWASFYIKGIIKGQQNG